MRGGVIPRRRARKTMLRCADLDLRERIRKYDLNVEDGAKLDEQAFRNYLLEKVAAARSEVRLDVLLRGLRFDPWAAFFNTTIKSLSNMAS